MHKLFLKNALLQSRSSIFESFVERIGNLECTQSRCNVWADFTMSFLKTKYDKIVHISELNPDNHNLSRKGVGIDLVALSKNGNCFAVEAIFGKNVNHVTRKEFCAFDALRNKSGPWLEKVTVTNSLKVDCYDSQCDNDRFYGFDFFNNLEKEEWFNILLVDKDTMDAKPYFFSLKKKNDCRDFKDKKV